MSLHFCFSAKEIHGSATVIASTIPSKRALWRWELTGI